MIKLPLLIPVVLVALAGCDATPTTTGYGATAPVQTRSAQYGTITKVRNVEVYDSGVENGNMVAGALTGAIIGGVVGNRFGSGSGKTVMTGAGAVGGALAGSHLAQGSGHQVSQQWTVRLDNGGSILIVQSDNSLYVGERVRVVDTGNGMRLMR